MYENQNVILLENINTNYENNNNISYKDYKNTIKNNLRKRTPINKNEIENNKKSSEVIFNEKNNSGKEDFLFTEKNTEEDNILLTERNITENRTEKKCASNENINNSIDTNYNELNNSNIENVISNNKNSLENLNYNNNNKTFVNTTNNNNFKNVANISSSNNNINNINISHTNLEILLSNISETLSRQNSGSFIVNNFNITIYHTNEITKTNNEVTINENNQINNTTNTTNTKSNNVNIEETVNNNLNASIYHYYTNYNVLNNSYFDHIKQSLNKGYLHNNRAVRIASIIVKYTFSIFCFIVNTTINTSIRIFKLFYWLITQLKDFEKIFKGFCYFILFLTMIACIYRSDYFRHMIVNFFKFIFNKKSSPKEIIPIEHDNIFSNFKNKALGVYTVVIHQSSYEILKYMTKLSGEKMNSFRTKTETFIVDNTKNIFGFTNKIINSTSPILFDKTSQIFKAMNSTLFSSVPVLKDHSIKIHSVVNSTVSKITNNDKINKIAHSLKNSLSNGTPKKIVSSSTEKIKSAIGNHSFHKIKGALVNVTSSSNAAKEVANKATGLFNKIKNVFDDISNKETSNNEETTKAAKP